MIKKEFDQKLIRFLKLEGMENITILTPWKEDYTPVFFESEGVKYFLKVKERVRASKKV